MDKADNACPRPCGGHALHRLRAAKFRPESVLRAFPDVDCTTSFDLVLARTFVENGCWACGGVWFFCRGVHVDGYANWDARIQLRQVNK